MKGEASSSVILGHGVCWGGAGVDAGPRSRILTVEGHLPRASGRDLVLWAMGAFKRLKGKTDLFTFVFYKDQAGSTVVTDFRGVRRGTKKPVLRKAQWPGPDADLMRVVPWGMDCRADQIQRLEIYGPWNTQGGKGSLERLYGSFGCPSVISQVKMSGRQSGLGSTKAQN